MLQLTYACKLTSR